MESMSQTTHNYFVEKNRIFKENHESEEQTLQIQMKTGTGKSLLSAYPKLMEEWDQERNTGIDPEQLTRTSEMPVNWKCRNGHLWTESVAHRIKYWMVCPECRRKAQEVKRNLARTQPELIEQWDWKKNLPLRPEMFTRRSKEGIWWRCELGHSWYGRISGRANGETACPYCNQSKLLAGFNDLQTMEPEIAAEWDVQANGKLRPDDVLARSKHKVWWICERGHRWGARVCERTEEGRGCPYCAAEQSDSAQIQIDPYAELREQWDAEKNAPLRLKDIDFDTYTKEIWWICEKGHSWQARIRERVTRHRGCPYCSGMRVLAGFNDLASQYPALAKQWAKRPNGTLRPEEVTAGSNTVVWWRCSRRHLWQATVYDRAVAGHGCPYCAGKKVLTGYNDLKTLNPALAAEWDDEKNAPLRPEEVRPGSHQRAWWRCKEGHSWQAQVKSRASGMGCPICAKKTIIVGVNDWAYANPEIAAEWDTEKNGIPPEQVRTRDNKKYWWRCKNGHSYQTTIGIRVGKQRTGCPYCTGKRVMVGETDLQTTFPELAAEWDYEKNTPLTPQQVTAGCNQKVYWICTKGHSYQAIIGSRTGRSRSGCPYCSGKRVLAGFNDLQTLYPEVAAEWHPTLNGDLKPTEVTRGSNKKVWWQCVWGHEWQAVIYSRTVSDRPVGCPECARAYARGKNYRDRTGSVPDQMPRRNLHLPEPETNWISGEEVLRMWQEGRIPESRSDVKPI